MFDEFLAIDAVLVGHAQLEATRLAGGALAHEASRCVVGAASPALRARCVVDALFAPGDFSAVAEPGDAESSTVTSALIARRANCAALAALALALADRLDVPLEAVVFSRHVVVRAPGKSEQVFELLERGAPISMSQLRQRLGRDGAHAISVRPRAFPAYYLDNLAVRFADAGDFARAEDVFGRAIEAAPKLARIRFNYGTFLMARDRLKPAEEQLRRAVRLDSRNAPAWANLGVASDRLGNSDEARRCFERALRHDPLNRTASENLRALDHNGPPPPR